MVSKKMTLMAFLIILIVLIVVVISFIALTGREHVSELQIINLDGTSGTALVVYHPGLSSFQEDVTKSFVDGLVSKGWRIEITTASSDAPSDITNYDLLVLGTPTYGSAPAKPLVNYIDRLDDLDGKPIVVICTALGSAQETLERVSTQIQEINGSVISSLTLTRMAPNDEQFGSTAPKEIAYRAGTEFALP